jgi:transcriptional regulator with XRE-family HTH domain
MDYLQKLGENLRRRILNSSATGSIELFAHENQIPKSTLSEVLNGKNDPRLSTLAKICSGLDIRLSDLFADPVLENLVAESAGKYRAQGSSKRAPARAPAKSGREKSESSRRK